MTRSRTELLDSTELKAPAKSGIVRRPRVTVIAVLIAVLAAAGLLAGRHLTTRASSSRTRTTGRMSASARTVAVQEYVATGTHDDLYLALPSANRVEDVDRFGHITATFGTRDSAARAPQSPHGITIGHDGSIYAAESYGCRIDRLSPSLQILGHWSTCGARSEGYDGPLSLATGPKGDIYATSRGSARIDVFSPSGSLLRSINTGGSRTEYGGIAVDQKGTIYLSEPETDQIIRLAASGTRTVWGSYGSAPGSFKQPGDIALDGTGALYVVDEGNQRVQKIGAGGRPVMSWGHDGSVPAVSPRGISVDVLGDTFVSGAPGPVVKISSSGIAAPAWQQRVPPAR